MRRLILLGVLALVTAAFAAPTALAGSPHFINSAFSISGNFTQSAAGNLNVVLGGSTAGLSGHLAVSGTATLGIAPEPFSKADLTFFDQIEAARWESAWPELRQKLRSNPLVVLTGFSGLLGRITLEREGAVLHVSIQATEMELVRLLQLLSTQLFPLGAH